MNEPRPHAPTFSSAPLARTTELPQQLRNDQLFQQLLAQRIIFVGGEIDDDLANRICSQLLLLAAESAERDILLYINSPGGSMDDGFAIYDVMQYLPNDI